jgi:predicted Zn-dependent peptidase
MKGLRLLIFIFMPMSLLQAEPLVVKTLPNGLRWIHKPVTHNQIMAFRLLLPGGGLQEPVDKTGITSLMCSVLFKGTENRTALQIAQEIESLGAAMGAGSQDSFWDMSGQVTVDNFPKTFALLGDILLRPSFSSIELEKERKALLNDIQAKKEHIFQVAHERLQKELFGDHPYGWPDHGTEKTVSSLSRENVVDWHKKCSDPRGAILVTVGSLPAKKVEALLEETFQGWKGHGEGFSKPVAPTFSNGPKTAEEFHPFEQSFLMVAYPAPALTDPDYSALKVLNAMLGSGMSSPLFQVVREDAGLAYDVSSFYPSRPLASSFVIYAGMDPKNLDLAHGKIKDLVEGFVSTYLTPESLKNAQHYIRGHYQMDHQTNSRLAWHLSWWESLGRGHTYDSRYLNDIDAVTVEDVRCAAQTIFSRPVTVVKIRSKAKA